MQLGPIYYDARRYEDAISTLEKLHSKDTIGVQLYLAASRAALGDTTRPGRLWQASLGSIRWPHLSGSRQLFWLPTKMRLIGTIRENLVKARVLGMMRLDFWTWPLPVVNVNQHTSTFEAKLTSSRHHVDACLPTSGHRRHRSSPQIRMSAFGHEHTSRHVFLMSAIPLKADIRQHIRLSASCHSRHSGRTLLTSRPGSVFCLALHRGFWATIRVAGPRG